MLFGLSSMNNPDDPSPGDLAVAIVERGFESLWIGEHTHIPASRVTPYPAGGEMPEAYKAMMDPFLSLLAAALAAPGLIVGTGVCLPLEHDLFDLAKTVATLDRLTGGRFQFGIGVGWNAEELANHRPIGWASRYRALAECVSALRRLWCDEESEFHGEFFDFDKVWSLPKPVQTPHPPVLCGMGGRLGTREALAWADAWMPMDVALGDVPRRVAKFREAAQAAGRDPSSIPLTMMAFADPDIATLESYHELGVQRVVLGANRTGWSDPGSLMPWLDGYAAIIEKLR